MIRIMVADDHPLFRKGLQKLLESSADIRVIAEAGNGCELVEKLTALKDINLLLLDISMPGMSGLDALVQVRAIRPDLPVLVLSMHEEEQYALRALKSGCRGYIVKSGSPEELVMAVRTAFRGECYLSPKIARTLTDYLSRDTEKKPHEVLSNREYDILCRIAIGISLTEIANTLNVSIKTVSTYKSRILKKLACHSNAELVCYAMENKLI